MKGTKRSRAALTVLTTLSLVGSSVIIPIGSEVKAEDLDSVTLSNSIELNPEVNFDAPLLEDDLNWEDVNLPNGVKVYTTSESQNNSGFNFGDFIDSKKLENLKESLEERDVSKFRKVHIYRSQTDNSELLDFLDQTQQGLKDLRLEGISLSEYAEKSGLSVEELKKVVEQMTTDRWEEMLADEQITQDQFNNRLVHLDEIVDRIINFDGSKFRGVDSGEMPLLIERAR